MRSKRGRYKWLYECRRRLKKETDPFALLSLSSPTFIECGIYDWLGKSSSRFDTLVLNMYRSSIRNSWEDIEMKKAGQTVSAEKRPRLFLWFVPWCWGSFLLCTIVAAYVPVLVLLSCGLFCGHVLLWVWQVSSALWARVVMGLASLFCQLV